jgi:hypothetical protein
MPWMIEVYRSLVINRLRQGLFIGGFLKEVIPNGGSKDYSTCCP